MTAPLVCPECGSPITIGYYEARCDNTNHKKCRAVWDADGRPFGEEEDGD